MKKLLALLLTAVLCLPLAACNENTNTECDDCDKYEKLIELLEDKDYQGAILEIQKIAENADKTDNDSNNKIETETIQITLDNWQNYFEIKTVPVEEFNAFDELESFRAKTIFVLKDEWKDRATECDVALEYSCTQGYFVEFTYNTDTKELTHADIPENPNWDDDEDDQLNVTAKYTLSYEDGRSLFNSSWRPSSFELDGKTAKIESLYYFNIEFHRVLGTLTITK